MDLNNVMIGLYIFYNILYTAYFIISYIIYTEILWWIVSVEDKLYKTNKHKYCI